MRSVPDTSDPGRNPFQETRGTLLARNTVLNLFGFGLPLLVGLIAIPFVIQGLGTDRFGILSLVWVVFGYFGLLDLGLGRATVKFVAESLGRGDVKEIPGYFWTTILFQLGLGILGGVTVAVSTSWITARFLKIPPSLIPEARTGLYILAAVFPLIILTAAFRGLLEAAQRFDLVNAVNIPAGIINYLAPLAAALAHWDIAGIILILALARLVAFLVWVWLGLKYFPGLRSALVFEKKKLGVLLKFGGWVTISGVVSPMLIYLDRFLIGTLLSIHAVGLYTPPSEAITRLWFIPGSLVLTLFPTFSNCHGREDLSRMQILFSAASKALLAGIGQLVIVMVVFAEPILKLWLGASAAGAGTSVFKILSIGFLLNSLAFVPYSFLQGTGRADIPAKFHLLETLVYLPLAWFLIRWRGIEGAALAWTLRVTADMGLLFLAAFRSGKISLLFLTNRRFLVTSLALVGAVLPGFLPVPWGWRILVFTVLSGLFLWLFWSRLLDPGEKGWLVKCVRGILGKDTIPSRIESAVSSGQSGLR